MGRFLLSSGVLLAAIKLLGLFYVPWALIITLFIVCVFWTLICNIIFEILYWLGL